MLNIRVLIHHIYFELTEQTNSGEVLSWSSRLKIALGSARGLAYLHHDCCPRVVHRDIKSSNILLDENMEPHVSDFGLAKLLKDEEAHVTTVVAGTFGYLAPGTSSYSRFCSYLYLFLQTIKFDFLHIYEQNICKVEERHRNLMYTVLVFFC